MTVPLLQTGYFLLPSSLLPAPYHEYEYNNNNNYYYYYYGNDKLLSILLSNLGCLRLLSIFLNFLQNPY